jgi:hypothetical protein
MVLYFAGRMGSVMAIHWILLNTQKSRFLLLVGFNRSALLLKTDSATLARFIESNSITWRGKQPCYKATKRR